MRILFLSHYFPPEVNAPATRTYEHCRQWVQDGHDVTVVERGDLFVGALAGRHLRRVRIDGGKEVEQQILLSDLGQRIRDVRAGPDGYLYLLTDDDNGKLIRVEPAS